jgi:hypothetical protein
MNEIALGLAWIYSTLANDSTMVSLAPGGFHRAMAPPTTQTPFVMFGYVSGADTTTANAFRLLSQLTFQIRAAGPATATNAIVAAAGEIDALFGGPTSGNTAGGFIDSCYRQSPVQFDELISGGQWVNLGGLYRLEIQRTS